MPSPTVSAMVRPRAASRISSSGNRSRRRASSISLVCESVSVDESFTMSSAPGCGDLRFGHSQVGSGCVLQPEVAAFQHRGMCGERGTPLRPLRPRRRDPLQHNVFPGQALAECGEEVSEQDLARRDVAHHPVQSDRQITRALRHTTDIRSAQRRADVSWLRRCSSRTANTPSLSSALPSAAPSGSDRVARSANSSGSPTCCSHVPARSTIRTRSAS